VDEFPPKGNFTVLSHEAVAAVNASLVRLLARLHVKDQLQRCDRTAHWCTGGLDIPFIEGQSTLQGKESNGKEN
jgi:hypothetical protein